MTTTRCWLAAVVLLAAVDGALAHGAQRIRKMLASEGFEDIDIRGKSSPFFVYACRDNDKYRMYFDYRGKRIEEAVVGSCDEDVESYPRLSDGLPGEPAEAAVDALGKAQRNSETSKPAGPPKPAASALKGPGKCARFVPAIGAVVEVACEQEGAR